MTTNLHHTTRRRARCQRVTLNVERTHSLMTGVALDTERVRILNMREQSAAEIVSEILPAGDADS